MMIFTEKSTFPVNNVITFKYSIIFPHCNAKCFDFAEIFAQQASVKRKKRQNSVKSFFSAEIP